MFITLATGTPLTDVLPCCPSDNASKLFNTSGCWVNTRPCAAAADPPATGTAPAKPGTAPAKPGTAPDKSPQRPARDRQRRTSNLLEHRIRDNLARGAFNLLERL